jgi:hypothetical protein
MLAVSWKTGWPGTAPAANDPGWPGACIGAEIRRLPERRALVLAEQLSATQTAEARATAAPVWPDVGNRRRAGSDR